MNTKALEIGGALQLSTTKKKPYLLLFLRTTVLTGLFSLSSGRSSSNSQKTKAALGPQLLRGPHHRPTTPSWAASPYGNDLFAFPHSNPNLLFLLDGKFRGPLAQAQAQAPAGPWLGRPSSPRGPRCQLELSAPKHGLTPPAPRLGPGASSPWKRRRTGS